jgi:hypothetical protein
MAKRGGGLEKMVAVIGMWGVGALVIWSILNAVQMGGLDALQRDLDRRVKAGWAGR